MFSLLYYLHILPYPYPIVKHYFQNFLIYSNGAGAPLAFPRGEGGFKIVHIWAILKTDEGWRAVHHCIRSDRGTTHQISARCPHQSKIASCESIFDSFPPGEAFGCSRTIAPIHRTNFPLVLRISYIIYGHNYSIGPTMVPGLAVNADRTSTSILWSLANSTLRSWRTWAPFSMSRSILP